MFMSRMVVALASRRRCVCIKMRMRCEKRMILTSIIRRNMLTGTIRIIITPIAILIIFFVMNNT